MHGNLQCSPWSSSHEATVVALLCTIAGRLAGTFRDVSSDDRSGADQSNQHPFDALSADEEVVERRRRDDDATGPVPRRDGWGRRIDPETGRPFERRSTDRVLPRWAIPAIGIFWLGFLLTFVARHVFERLSDLLVLLLVSMFLTLAIEPGVDRLARRGWRRGTATLAILLGVLGAFLVFLAAMGTLVGTQVADLLSESETYITDSIDWVNSTFGTQIDPQAVVDEFNDPNGRVQEFIQSQGDEAVRLSVTAVGVIFKMLSVLLFTYYLVADGPRLRRAICSRLRPSRQEQVLMAWEVAITKTGGYLYSRALLALLSAISHWVLFQAIGTPAPVALALWVGLISQFLPVVGTYLAGILPVLVTILESPVDAAIVVIFIVLYQQIENYLLAPRITARTMELHPAVAFGAALGGAALLGAVGAILALPAAAMAQALATGWGQRYDVIEDPLTAVVEKKHFRRPFRRRDS
jgi:predicted PurR-regulated permease PerM